MTVVVTGAAGFIGSHVSKALLARGERVLGLDDLNPYYDPALKQARKAELEALESFAFEQLNIADREAVGAAFARDPEIDRVIHLAAQAGVRHSLTDPYSYVQSNVMGQVVIMEACRKLARFSHLVYASSSSVYGGNRDLPFSIEDRVDQPVSLYAASKRSAELSAACYAHLFDLPMTGLRFFTVYGPWGRPDMSAYIFTKAILEGQAIEVFNHGDMKRDFTYVDDIVAGVIAALDRPPTAANGARPHKLYNLGNHRSEDLMRFIGVIEEACGREAEKVFKEMQPGDVKETYADIEAARRDLDFEPRVSIDEGIPRFVAWYRDYHGC